MGVTQQWVERARNMGADGIWLAGATPTVRLEMHSARRNRLRRAGGMGGAVDGARRRERHADPGPQRHARADRDRAPSRRAGLPEPRDGLLLPRRSERRGRLPGCSARPRGHLRGAGGEARRRPRAARPRGRPPRALQGRADRAHRRSVPRVRAARVPHIAPILAKVVSVHGPRDASLHELQAIFRELSDALLPHLDEEEQVLFPAILAPRPDPGVVKRELERMVGDHLVVGRQLARIRTLTQCYSTPEWGCTTYRVLMSELEALEADTLRHVHLENHVLAPLASRAA